jgi:hypothetical protein
MLEAGRSAVRVTVEVDSFNLPNPSSRTMALGSTQPLTKKLVLGIFLGVKSGRRVGLTTLPPSMSRMSENVGASTSRKSKGLHGLYRDNFTLLVFHQLRIHGDFSSFGAYVFGLLTSLFSRVQTLQTQTLTVRLQRKADEHGRITFCISFSGGWSPNWVHSARRSLTGLLYLPRVIVRIENLVE